MKASTTAKTRMPRPVARVSQTKSSAYSWGYLHPCRYVLHDCDTKFCASFRSVLAEGGVKTIALSARSPNLNAFAESWVSLYQAGMPFEAGLIRRGLAVANLNRIRRSLSPRKNHQGNGNKLLFPVAADESKQRGHTVECRQRLGGYLNIMAAPHKFFDRTGCREQAAKSRIDSAVAAN